MQIDAVTSSNYIRPIQLPDAAAESLAIDQNSCDITGWGTTQGV